jgi:predicted dehydrogenase
MTNEQRSVYRAALIGLGFIGAGDEPAGREIGQNVVNLDGTHFDALRNNERIELVAGCDRQAERCDRFRQRSGLPVYRDWRELLNDVRPEIVSVATNSPSHAEITIGCARAGVKAVYCEKPIATRIVDAERMLAACRETDTLLVVNHNRRFSPLYRELRDLVVAGELGTLTSCNLQWAAGRLGNVGTHFFDAIEMLTGREIEAVSGTLDAAGLPDCRGPEYRDPGGWGLLQLSGGLMVTVDAGEQARIPASVTINGTAGRATIGKDGVRITSHDGVEKHLPPSQSAATSMDHAVAEIVAALDDAAGRRSLYPPHVPSRIFEAIVAFHVSSDLHGGWVSLPVDDVDRTREIRIG